MLRKKCCGHYLFLILAWNHTADKERERGKRKGLVSCEEVEKTYNVKYPPWYQKLIEEEEKKSRLDTSNAHSHQYRIQLLTYPLHKLIFRPRQNSSQAVHQLPYMACMCRAPRPNIIHINRVSEFEMHPQFMYGALSRNRETERGFCRFRGQCKSVVKIS